MKVLALFLIICMVTFSALPGRAVTLNGKLKKDYCHKPVGNAPCNQSKNDCGQDYCNMLACNSCGFLKADPISIAAVLPIIKETVPAPYYSGNLSGYSFSSWHPPKV